MSNEMRSLTEKRISETVRMAGLPERFARGAVNTIDNLFTETGVMPSEVRCVAPRDVEVVIHVPQELQDVGNGLVASIA